MPSSARSTFLCENVCTKRRFSSTSSSHTKTICEVFLLYREVCGERKFLSSTSSPTPKHLARGKKTFSFFFREREKRKKIFNVCRYWDCQMRKSARGCFNKFHRRWQPQHFCLEVNFVYFYLALLPSYVKKIPLIKEKEEICSCFARRRGMSEADTHTLL